MYLIRQRETRDNCGNFPKPLFHKPSRFQQRTLHPTLWNETKYCSRIELTKIYIWIWQYAYGPGLAKWDLWWTKWRWGRFSPSTSVSPANLHSTKFSIIIIIRGRYNRPFSGRRAEWTQLGLRPPLCEFKKKLFRWKLFECRNLVIFASAHFVSLTLARGLLFAHSHSRQSSYSSL
jgi:hypothetical protein